MWLVPSVVTMNIAFDAIVPGIVMPPAMVLAIVIPLLVALTVAIARIMYDFTIVHDAAR